MQNSSPHPQRLSEADAKIARRRDLQRIGRISASKITSDLKLEITLDALATTLARLRDKLQKEKHPDWWQLADSVDDVMDIYEWKFGPVPSLIDAQGVLDYIAEVGLRTAGELITKDIALAIWHEEFVPELTAVEGPFRDQAIWLVAKLVTVDSVSVAQRAKLEQELAKHEVPTQGTLCEELETVFGQFAPELLPLQTKEFALKYREGLQLD
jgi:hypothetical protein